MYINSYTHTGPGQKQSPLSVFVFNKRSLMVLNTTVMIYFDQTLNVTIIGALRNISTLVLHIPITEQQLYQPNRNFKLKSLISRVRCTEVSTYIITMVKPCHGMQKQPTKTRSQLSMLTPAYLSHKAHTVSTRATFLPKRTEMSGKSHLWRLRLLCVCSTRP